MQVSTGHGDSALAREKVLKERHLFFQTTEKVDLEELRLPQEFHSKEGRKLKPAWCQPEKSASHSEISHTSDNLYSHLARQTGADPKMDQILWDHTLSRTASICTLLALYLSIDLM